MWRFSAIKRWGRARGSQPSFSITDLECTSDVSVRPIDRPLERVNVPTATPYSTIDVFPSVFTLVTRIPSPPTWSGRTRGYVKRGLETDLNGQRRIPLRGLKNRRSVQAESPYDAMARATALEEAFSRLKRVRFSVFLVVPIVQYNWRNSVSRIPARITVGEKKKQGGVARFLWRSFSLNAAVLSYYKALIVRGETTQGSTNSAWSRFPELNEPQKKLFGSSITNKPTY